MSVYGDQMIVLQTCSAVLPVMEVKQHVEEVASVLTQRAASSVGVLWDSLEMAALVQVGRYCSCRLIS